MRQITPWCRLKVRQGCRHLCLSICVCVCAGVSHIPENLLRQGRCGCCLHRNLSLLLKAVLRAKKGAVLRDKGEV